MTEASVPTHSHRVTLLLAVVALLVAAYGVWRGDVIRDREVTTRERVTQLELGHSALRTELTSLTERANKERAASQAQLQQLIELPQQVKDLTAAHEDLRSRTERPQRAWGRAEALYLVELAERRLTFDRDIATAISALESADTRLAALRDGSLTPIRERIARDLQMLRAVPDPDRSGLAARLAAVESQIESLPLKGVIVGQRVTRGVSAEEQSIFARAADAFKAMFRRLFAVHRLDGENAQIVTLESQTLRRQHLILLAHDARHAVVRSDAAAYRRSLAAMRTWLDKYFEKEASVEAAKQEVIALESVEIAPTLPDVSATVRLLRRVTPAQGLQ
ncbi:MAG TPA: uroporphyrinogen-III C-methyltransferase [Steroidobacteraceae bacterium]|nr:uroporphyrinogen-III C-methyltransferase [Steroidobacteraceae bacterium]